jgi:fructokinase
MQMISRVAGIELGGTKGIAVLARGNEIMDRHTLPTTTPAETLGALGAQLALWHDQEPLSAIGIASFGPVQLDPDTSNHGHLLATPKAGWSGAAVAAGLVGALTVPWAIDTDVNGAALAEWRWGAGQGCNSLCYVTIGTGVGGGLLINGAPVHGAMHPEIGHLRLRRAEADLFAGVCPFHADCIEGLVSGPALARRFAADPASVADGDPRWAPVAADLAELVGTVLLTTSAQRVLLGGGVMTDRPLLMTAVRARVVAQLGAYLPFLTQESAQSIIAAPALGADAGPLGAVALALQALA